MIVVCNIVISIAVVYMAYKFVETESKHDNTRVEASRGTIQDITNDYYSSLPSNSLRKVSNFCTTQGRTGSCSGRKNNQ